MKSSRFPESMSLTKSLTAVNPAASLDISEDTRGGIMISVGRSVFDFMNSRAVHVQLPSQGETNHSREAVVVRSPKNADDVALFRLSGACVMRMIKKRLKIVNGHAKCRKETMARSQREIDILRSYEARDKLKLPAAYLYLDRGHLFALDPAFLPFLQTLDETFKTHVNHQSFIELEKDLFMLGKAAMRSDKNSEAVFNSCCESLSLETTLYNSDVRAVYREFLDKYSNTRCNDFLKSMVELDGDKSQKVMLRDKLKAMSSS